MGLVVLERHAVQISVFALPRPLVIPDMNVGLRAMDAAELLLVGLVPVARLATQPQTNVFLRVLPRQSVILGMSVE